MTKKILGIVAVLALAGAGTARADFKDFSYRCTPGALRSCASLQVLTTLNGSGGTDVVVRVRNLAGSFYADQTNGSLITRLGITTPAVVLSGGLTVQTVGGATSTAGAAGLWFLRNPGSLGGPIELTAGLTPGSLNGGIAGCLPSYSGWQTERFETCAPDGWVEFSFSTMNAWSANDAELAWLIQDATSPAGGAEECNSSTTNTQHRLNCGVAPEPVTMVLLGSGLAGMGAMRLARRRRREDEATTD